MSKEKQPNDFRRGLNIGGGFFIAAVVIIAAIVFGYIVMRSDTYLGKELRRYMDDVETHGF